MTYVMSMAKALTLAATLYVGAPVRCPSQRPTEVPACEVLALAHAPNADAVVVLVPRAQEASK